MKKIIYGISYNGILYGWYERELYRLPIVICLRNFGFKKLKKVPIGNNFGYRLSQKGFTIKQLQNITCLLNEPYLIKEINHESTPFQHD